MTAILAATLVICGGLVMPARSTAAASLPAPAVLGWSPGIARNVPLTGPLTVYFNRTMDRASVEHAWHLTPRVPGTFRYSSQGIWQDTSVTFVPSRPLTAGAYYRLVIGQGARDRQGTPLQHPFSLTFSTGDALKAERLSPAPGTTDVPVNGLIAVTFNHPMVALAGLSTPSQNPAGWQVSISPRTAGYGNWLGTSTWVFHPRGTLAPSSRYDVTLRGTVRDAWGDPLGRNLHWAFHTVGPQIIAESPGNGARFSNPAGSIKASFNQAMERSSTARAFSLRVSGRPVTGSVTWQGNTLVFRPRTPLNSSSAYVAAFGAGARSVNGKASLCSGSSRGCPSWRFHVAPPPRLLSTLPGPGATQVYSSVELHFNAPMNQRSLDRHLSVSPSLGSLYTSLWGPNQDSEFVYTINGDFQPSTHYTISLRPGVLDRFSRPLAQSTYTLSFKTARLAPLVALYGMPGASDGIVFSAGRVVSAPVQIVNLPKVRYTLVRTTFAALANLDSSDAPPAGKTIRSWSETLPHPLNKVENLGVRLAAKDGSALPPGLYWLGAEGPDGLPGQRPESGPPASSEIVVVSNVSITEKIGGNGALVWVTSAQTGRPLSGVRVRLLDNQADVLATGQTDANGLYFFHQSFNQGPPHALIDDGAHFGLTKGYWQPNVSFAGPFPGFIGPYYGPSSGGAYAYTDRPVYRPGQRVYFRAVLWRDSDAVYSLFGRRLANANAWDSRGRQLYHARLMLDRRGAVYGSFKLPGNGPTGFGQITISLPNGRSELAAASISFSVADYRKPEFLTAVSASRPSYVQGQTVAARVRVQYVFGAPVTGQPVSWTACSQPLFVQPPSWEEYTFFDWETYWQQSQTQGQPAGGGSQCATGSLMAWGRVRTNATGVAAIRLPVNLSGLPVDQTVTVEATTTDINHQSVSGRVQVQAYKSAYHVGLLAQQEEVPAGQRETVGVAAVRPDGKAVSNQSLTARIYLRTYTTRLAKSGGGWSNWESVPHDRLLDTRHIVTNRNGKTSFSFIPKGGGEYRVVVEGRDAAGHATQTALSIYASAAGFSDWGQSDNTSITLKADKPSYRVGEMAHVLVAAPFGNATALVTVERGTIRSERVQHLATNSSAVDVPVTLDDLPNVYVTVTVYRGWRNGNPPDWRYGTVELHVKVDPRHLVVHLFQNRKRYHPRDPVTYTITTADARGHPVSAELSLALVDTAVLALQNESNPDILKALYSERPLGVSTASAGILSIDHLQVKPNSPIQPINVGGLPHRVAAPIAAAAPKAGGGGGGQPGLTVRSQFADTAYWSGSLMTNRSGRATLRLRLPDDTTTWRLDARGITGGQSVGQANLRTLSTKDIVVRPVAPRFFLQGDSLKVGAVVNDNLQRPVNVAVSVSASGVGLASKTVSVRVPARGERLILWPASVPETGSARLTFRAVPSTPGVQGDAVQIRLPVHPPLTDETVATAGQVFGSIKQYVVVPANAVPRPGALTVQVSASLTAGMGAAFTQFHASRFESNADTADRVLAASALRSLPPQLTGLSRSSYARLPMIMAAGVLKLADNQLGDGGWPWFNGLFVQSDPAISADVVEALSAAGSRMRFERSVLAQGRAYLRRSLGTVPPSLRAHLLLVLARSGSADRRPAEGLYTNTVVRAHLDTADLADLSLALALSGDFAKARSLVADLDSRAMVSATGAHWEGTGQSYFTQPAVSTTVEALAALVRLAPLDPFVPAAARWLMLARQGSSGVTPADAGWDCSHDTAEALAALAAYARAAREGSAAYQYQVEVDGRVRLAGRYDRTSQRRVDVLRVPVSDLQRRGASAVVVGREPFQGTLGPGPLYYLERLRYFLQARSIQSRDEGLSISRSYLTAKGKPISTAAAGSLVAVKLTIHTGQTLEYLDIEDPIPSGFEPLDQSLNISQQATPVPGQPVNPWEHPDLSWYLIHSDLRDDRVSLHVSFLPPGTYTYTYLAEATVPGQYAVAPLHASEAFFPEVFGRGAGQTFTVR